MDHKVNKHYSLSLVICLETKTATTTKGEK